MFLTLPVKFDCFPTKIAKNKEQTQGCDHVGIICISGMWVVLLIGEQTIKRLGRFIKEKGLSEQGGGPGHHPKSGVQGEKLTLIP